MDVWLSSSSCVINLAAISKWEKTSVFFRNFGLIENSKPFFNDSISSMFNWYFDKFVTASCGSKGNILLLVRLRNFFWWVFKILLSFFLTLRWIDSYRRNQVIPSHLDLINWIFFSRCICKFFCSRHLLCKSFFRSCFLIDLTSLLFGNGISSWINFGKTWRVLQFLKKFISNNALFLFL